MIDGLRRVTATDAIASHASCTPGHRENPRVSSQGHPRAARRAGAARRSRVQRRRRPATSPSGSAATSSSSRRRFTPAAAARAAASSSPSRRTRPSRSPSEMIGMTLVTHQTGPEGRMVERVLVEEGLQIDARAVPRPRPRPRRRQARCHGQRRPAAWTSRRSRPKTPEQIYKESHRPGAGLMPFQARQARASRSASTAPQVNKAVKLMTRALRRVRRAPTRRWSRSTR